MAIEHLPDPAWTDGPQECLGCGYALAGLAAPGLCPECGAPFDAQAMVLHGVARSSSGAPMWRRIAWAFVFIAGFILIETMVFIGAFLGWIMVLVFACAITGAAVWLLATGPRERRGTERFILTSAGMARVPAKPAPGQRIDSILIPLADCTIVKLERISPVWRRLRICAVDPRTLSKVIDRFDAGIRCPDASAQTVEQTIRGLLPALRRAVPPPPIAPSNTPSNPGSPQPPPLP